MNPPSDFQFEVGKDYTAYDGNKLRCIAVSLPGNYPVLCVVLHKDYWYTGAFTTTGHYWTDKHPDKRNIKGLWPSKPILHFNPHPWLKWLAMDCDGTYLLCSEQPIHGEKMWFGGEVSSIHSDYITVTNGLDWKEACWEVSELEIQLRQ